MLAVGLPVFLLSTHTILTLHEPGRINHPSRNRTWLGVLAGVCIEVLLTVPTLATYRSLFAPVDFFPELIRREVLDVIEIGHYITSSQDSRRKGTAVNDTIP
jgi:hypothetical protein